MTCQKKIVKLSNLIIPKFHVNFNDFKHLHQIYTSGRAGTKSSRGALRAVTRILSSKPGSVVVLRKFHNPKHAGTWIVENGYSNGHPDTCGGRISEVCRNTNKACTAYGFKWRFEERSID